MLSLLSVSPQHSVEGLNGVLTMKLIVRRKVAVPPLYSAPSHVEVSSMSLPALMDLNALLRAMSRDASRDGLESGDVLVEVLSGGNDE